MTAARFADVLDRVADTCPLIEVPRDGRRRRWLLASVRLAQLELADLEARLIEAADRRINGTPRPKTPAEPTNPPPQRDTPPDPPPDPQPGEGS